MLVVAKIVYNNCFGGASLSDKAVERYAELKGITLYREENPGGWFESHYYLCPVEEYDDMMDDDPKKNDMYFSGYSILDDRTDPVLVQVIEELGKAANGFVANLKIRELPAGTQYRIDEYDGSESVMTPDDYNWLTA
jgi:hypothetical protein